MRLKRIISIALLISLMSVMFACLGVYADESAENVASNNQKEARVLYALGIIDVPDESIAWENMSITNRQFLTYAINMTGYNGFRYSYAVLPTGEISPSDEDYDKYVYAFSNGWIKKESGIAPDNELTADFAMNILSGVLGYKSLIENGAQNMKNRLMTTLMDGVTIGAERKLSFNSAVRMLYNAIDAEFCEQVIISGNSLTWNVLENETVLSVNKNIYKIKGRVTATQFATVTGLSVGEEQIAIDEKIYNIDDKAFNSYIGKNVEGYVYVDDYGAKILYLEVTSSTREIVIKGEDFVSYTPEAVSYYNENGDMKTIRVSDPVIIYNGKELRAGQYSDELFEITEGDVTLLKNNNVVDVIIVSKYQNLVVGTVDKNSMTVSDMFRDRTIEFDCEEISLKNEMGKDVDISSVKKKNIITYMSSLDGQYINAVIGGTIITEKVSGIRKGQEKKYDYIKLGNVGYDVAAELESNEDTIVLGEAYEMFINVNKRIVAAKTPSGINVNLAYMTGAGLNTEPFDKSVKVQLYTADSVDEEDYVVFDCAKKVRVDGTLAEGGGIIDALKIYNGTLTIPITYGFDSEGRINVIDTPNYVRDKENNNTLVKRSSRTTPISVVSTISYGYRNHFAGKYYFSWDGICINHPSVNQTTHSPEKKDDIVITDRVRTNTKRYTDLYSLGYDSPIVYFSIADDNSSNDPSKVAWKDETVIIKDISVSLKADDTVGTFVTLITNGSEETVEVSEKYKDDILKAIDKFDIIRYKADAKEEMIAAEQILDFTDLESTIGNESVEWGNSEYRYVVGKCYDIVDDSACRTAAHKNILSFFKNPLSIQESMEATYMKNAYMYTVNKDEISIETCTPDMVRTYKGSGDNADMVVLVTGWNAVPTAVYIIRAND